MISTYTKPVRDMRLAELAGWRRQADQDRAGDSAGLTCLADNDPAIRERRLQAAESRIRPELERIEQGERQMCQSRQANRARRKAAKGR
jgi:hypothetical protein